MIYPKISCETKSFKIDTLKQARNTLTSYLVKDGTLPVGRVDLMDTKKGAYVVFVENQAPDYYKHFGILADMITVNHCMKRNKDTFEIVSEAGLNSHVQHYKCGKRFFDDKINKLVELLIRTNPKEAQFDTRSLGNVKMFMPKNLIQKYMEKLKEHPLI